MFASKVQSLIERGAQIVEVLEVETVEISSAQVYSQTRPKRTTTNLGGQFEYDPRYNGSENHRWKRIDSGSGTVMCGYILRRIAIISAWTSASDMVSMRSDWSPVTVTKYLRVRGQGRRRRGVERRRSSQMTSREEFLMIHALPDGIRASCVRVRV